MPNLQPFRHKFCGNYGQNWANSKLHEFAIWLNEIGCFAKVGELRPIVDHEGAMIVDRTTLCPLPQWIGSFLEQPVNADSSESANRMLLWSMPLSFKFRTIGSYQNPGA